jgi:hypothetical protein
MARSSAPMNPRAGFIAVDQGTGRRGGRHTANTRPRRRWSGRSPPQSPSSAARRSPRRARPRARVITVWVLVASTKTTCSAAQHAISSAHWVRATGSCSVAITVFFERQMQPPQGPAHRRVDDYHRRRLCPAGTVFGERGIGIGGNLSAQLIVLGGGDPARVRVPDPVPASGLRPGCAPRGTPAGRARRWSIRSRVRAELRGMVGVCPMANLIASPSNVDGL